MTLSEEAVDSGLVETKVSGIRVKARHYLTGSMTWLAYQDCLSFQSHSHSRLIRKSRKSSAISCWTIFCGTTLNKLIVDLLHCQCHVLQFKMCFTMKIKILFTIPDAESSELERYTWLNCMFKFVFSLNNERPAIARDF